MVRHVLEEDFITHIKKTVDADFCGTWIFIVDRLNTHQSESLVRFVAERCDIEGDLGVKGKSGIVKSMKKRMKFLKDQSHRIRFVYTPKHTSWLNQVEIWFSILVRRLLKRGSFTSIEDLRNRILGFIEYFNKTLAKPFKMNGGSSEYYLDLLIFIMVYQGLLARAAIKMLNSLKRI